MSTLSALCSRSRNRSTDGAVAAAKAAAAGFDILGSEEHLAGGRGVEGPAQQPAAADGKQDLRETIAPWADRVPDLAPPPAAAAR